MGTYIIYIYLFIYFEREGTYIILLCDSETSGPVRSHLNVERSPPSALDAQAGYAHCMSNASYHMPHFLQNPLGRSAQQPSQQFNYVQRSYVHGDWNPHNDQATPDSSNKPGPHSPGKSNFSTDEPWGKNR